MDTVAEVSPRVLFADDDAAVREVMGEFFTRKGWFYDAVADGAQALSAATAERYDVIISDLEMPHVNGIDLVRALRTQVPGQAIIILSASNSHEKAEQSIREGALQFLGKPVDFDALERCVSQLVAGIRSKRRQSSLHVHLASESSTYEFLTEEISALKFSPPLLEKLLQSGQLDITEKLRLELAFQEALANAIEHGNLELRSIWREEIDSEGVDRFSKLKKERLGQKKFAHRRIEIRSMYDRKSVLFSITDQGPGFEVSPVPAHKSEGKVFLSGRGIAILQGCMDVVTYEDNGRRIVFEKFLEPKREKMNKKNLHGTEI